MGAEAVAARLVRFFVRLEAVSPSRPMPRPRLRAEASSGLAFYSDRHGIFRSNAKDVDGATDQLHSIA